MARSSQNYIRQSVFIKCLKIEYEYTDLELNQKVKKIDYVDDVPDLVSYFINLVNDNHVLDVHSHPNCRVNPSFKISSVELTEKSYNKIFDLQTKK